MVVCDTSPLLLLAKVGRLRLLTTLYGQVEIPTAVLDEVNVQQGADAEAIRQWRRRNDLPVREASGASLHSLPEELGKGERAAIALAIERDADLVVLDDQEGRRVAKGKGLSVTGTIGVLVEARASGHVDSLRQELDRVVEAGLWISESFYERLLQEFGES
jgi:Predicted nucleic acid-binding protein, contains PIN domain